MRCRAQSHAGARAGRTTCESRARTCRRPGPCAAQGVPAALEAIVSGAKRAEPIPGEFTSSRNPGGAAGSQINAHRSSESLFALSAKTSCAEGLEESDFDRELFLDSRIAELFPQRFERAGATECRRRRFALRKLRGLGAVFRQIEMKHV